MRKDKVLGIFAEVLQKSGMEDIVSLSENTNELADIMIYQEQGAPEYLALDGTPLFQFYEIRNILYKYGEDKVYNFVGTELQFVIELAGDACYILEFGDNGLCEAMYYNGKWVQDKDLSKALAQYNQKVLKRGRLESLIYAVAKIVEDHEEVSDSELEVVREKVTYYMDENPTDLEFLFMYAYVALQTFVYEDADSFDIKSIFERIVRGGCEDEFEEYILRENTDSDGSIGVAGYYLGLLETTTQLMREVGKDDATK